nr:MAG TPA: hypothetical protein [Caudoviricetes sp.]
MIKAWHNHIVITPRAIKRPWGGLFLWRFGGMKNSSYLCSVRGE